MSRSKGLAALLENVFVSALVAKKKKFYNIDNKDRCYKTIPWLLPQHANNIKCYKTQSPQSFPRYLNEPQCRLTAVM
jgi:hypothetical protein